MLSEDEDPISAAGDDMTDPGQSEVFDESIAESFISKHRTTEKNIKQVIHKKKSDPTPPITPVLCPKTPKVIRESSDLGSRAHDSFNLKKHGKIKKNSEQIKNAFHKEVYRKSSDNSVRKNSAEQMKNTFHEKVDRKCSDNSLKKHTSFAIPKEEITNNAKTKVPDYETNKITVKERNSILIRDKIKSTKNRFSLKKDNNTKSKRKHSTNSGKGSPCFVIEVNVPDDDDATVQEEEQERIDEDDRMQRLPSIKVC